MKYICLLVLLHYFLPFIVEALIYVRLCMFNMQNHILSNCTCSHFFFIYFLAYLDIFGPIDFNGNVCKHVMCVPKEVVSSSKTALLHLPSPENKCLKPIQVQQNT